MLSTIFHEMSFTTVTFIVVISLCAIYLHLKYSQSIAHKAPAPMSREHIVIQEVVARPPEDRPAHDIVDGIAEWLVGPARHIVSGVASFDEFAWRLLAAGLPLLRVTLHVGTIHPQFLGTTMVWWRDIGKTTQVLIGHEIGDAIPYKENPVRRVCEGRETLRRRLDFPDDGAADRRRTCRRLHGHVCDRPARRLHGERDRRSGAGGGAIGGRHRPPQPVVDHPQRAKRLSGRQNRAQGPCRPDPPRLAGSTASYCRRAWAAEKCASCNASSSCLCGLISRSSEPPTP